MNASSTEFANNSKRISIPWFMPWLIAILLLVDVARVLRPTPNVLASPRIRAEVDGYVNTPIKTLSALGLAVAKLNLVLDTRERRAIGELDVLYQNRVDLQTLYVKVDGLDLTGLLNWALQDLDPGSFRISPYRAGLRDVLVAIQAGDAP